MVNSVIAAYIATTINPERMFGLVYVWMSLAYAVLLYFLPAISTAYGGDSLYIVTAMIVLLCIPFLFILPQKINAVIEINKSVEPKSNNLSLLLIVTTLSFLTYGGVYAFSERVAAELSLSAEQMGSAFGLSTIAAIAGAWFTSWAGLRWGRKTPLIGAVLLAGLSYVLILSGGTIFTFFLGMLLYGLMSMVFNSYIYGTAAAVDPSGKTATIIVGYSLIPYSLGSCVIGSIANKWPYHLLGYPALVINIIAILILLPVLYKVDRKTSSLSNDSIG
jgi:predicted MFS family arabinose efflux permease